MDSDHFHLNRHYDCDGHAAFAAWYLLAVSPIIPPTTALKEDPFFHQ
ncbi:hypothetical protein HGP28_03155 [Vibrio sp. SM6]|uniref:Uncharacterized protein n=1 Tax=Vibrio agarilyticus TaxID=2726741 RepID=A0A7X8YFP7_9VIBR|nr:hypothetical protein [Vibrio agarilyticus]NLS11889.1 hypothetical protein [Vibrio agarilyticus]